jgi:hypothetical protein
MAAMVIRQRTERHPEEIGAVVVLTPGRTPPWPHSFIRKDRLSSISTNRSRTVKAANGIEPFLEERKDSRRRRFEADFAERRRIV